MKLTNPADILAAYERHAAPHVREQMVGCVVETASGAIVRGAGGMDLVDLASGGFGFGHPRVKAAVEDKVRRGPLSSRILINRSLAELVVQLADVAPGDLSVSYVCNSGEEALDSSLKLAKGHWPHRHKVVVAQGADHGSLSHGVYFAGLGSRYLGGLTFTPERLPFGNAEAFCQAIDENTAAVLLEPLSIDQGELQASQAFWQAVRARCHQTGALLIVNELRTGLGRSGRVFAVEATGICPDVLIVGGALSGGFVSVGAYVTTQAINNKVYDRRNPSLHGSTTGANPASCAAALSSLAVMREHAFEQQHRAMGAQAQTWLTAFANSQPECGLRRVQTVGSLTAVDVDDPALAHRVRRRALELGVLLRQPVGARLLVYPPMLISKDEHRAGLHMLIAAIKDVAGADTPPVRATGQPVHPTPAPAIKATVVAPQPQHAKEPSHEPI
jgi:acetylornithine/succinyldiaminopimelate/putrescine aminotransferase